MMKAKDIDKYHSIDTYQTASKKRCSFRNFANDVCLNLFNIANVENDLSLKSNSKSEQFSTPVASTVRTRSSSRVKRKLWEIKTHGTPVQR